MKRFWKKPLDWLVWLTVRLMICFVQSLSEAACLEGARFLAFFFADILRLRRCLLLDNLAHAFPEMSLSKRKRMVREVWVHLFLLVAEVALTPRRINETNWWHYVRLVDYQPMMALMNDTRPIIIVTGHLGNFELGGYTLGLLGYPTYSVARTLDNPYLNRYLAQFREMTGQYLISKNEGYDEILEVLRHGETVAFLADQSAGPKGQWVDFFGRPASAYKAMALLSLEYDAPIFVCAAIRRDNLPLHFELRGLGLFDPRDKPENLTSVAEITQWFTGKLEGCIKSHPNQYWWIHHRWKTYNRKFEKTESGHWRPVRG